MEKPTEAAVNDRDLSRDGFPRHEDRQISFSRITVNRNLCIGTLTATWMAGIACISVGVFLDHNLGDAWVRPRKLTISRATKEVVPLLINIVVTILTEVTGFIHATALRWALGMNLHFNSTLRLFTTVRNRWAFSTVSNFFNTAWLILAYATPSLILSNSPPSAVCDAMPSDEYYCGSQSAQIVYLRSGIVIALGVALTGNAALTTWQLYASNIVTWSSSPLETARASVATGLRSRREGRCMMGVDEMNLPSAPNLPKSQQVSAWSAFPAIRHEIRCLWLLFVATFAWFLAVLIPINVIWHKCQAGGDCSWTDGMYFGPSWALLPDTSGITSLVTINFFDKGIAKQASFAFSILIILAIQVVLTMTLSSTDILVNLSRDEDTWRQAYRPSFVLSSQPPSSSSSSASCYTPHNALRATLTSPQTLLLLFLKPLLHWLFGLGMTIYLDWGIFMRPPQILYLSMGVLVLAVFETWLCVRRPKGPQPATYGHLQTLVDLVDEWGEGGRIYWGHKGVLGMVAGQWVCHAGTAGRELRRVNMRERYAGVALQGKEVT